MPIGVTNAAASAGWQVCQSEVEGLWLTASPLAPLQRRGERPSCRRTEFRNQWFLHLKFERETFTRRFSPLLWRGAGGEAVI